MLPSHPMVALDALHRHLTDQELKHLLRRRFTRAGLGSPLLENLDEVVLLIRHHNFADFIDGLERTVQELISHPPAVQPVDLAKWSRQNDEAIAAYQARMREISPTYQPGDRFEFCGELYEIVSYQREGEIGYLLWGTQGSKSEIFIPIEHEDLLQPVLH